MKLVIIAGGKGTRLGLKDLPKPMLEVSGKPMLVRQIELAIHYGIEEIFILTGHLSEVIESYFQRNYFSAKITIIKEKKPLGSGGCLKLLEQHIKDRFLVFNGDLIMDFNIKRFIEFDSMSPNSYASIIAHPNDHPLDSDLLELKENSDQVLKFNFKPHNVKRNFQNLVNAGVFIFSPQCFKDLEPDSKVGLEKGLLGKALSNKKEIYAYRTTEYIKDAGTPSRVKKVESHIEKGLVADLNISKKQKAIFIDRDGVINHFVDHLIHEDDFKLNSQVNDALKIINSSPYLAILVTNQPMIAKGFMSFATLQKIHNKMETLLGMEGSYLDDIFFCPHHPEKGFDGEVFELKIPCDCRKPKNGMLRQAAEKYNIELNESWMIGDKETDIQAGFISGCKTVLVQGEPMPVKEPPDLSCKSLFEAVQNIID